MKIQKSVWILLIVFLFSLSSVISTDVTFLTPYHLNVDSCQSAVYSLSFSSAVDDVVTLSLKGDVEHSFSLDSFPISSGSNALVELLVSPGCVVGSNEYTLVVESGSGVVEYPVVVNSLNIYSHRLDNAKYADDGSVIYYNSDYDVCVGDETRIPIVIENKVPIGNSYDFILDGADFASLEADYIELFGGQKGLIDLILNPTSIGEFRLKVASKSVRGDVIVDSNLDVNVVDCYSFNLTTPSLLNGCFGEDYSFDISITNLGTSAYNFSISSSDCLNVVDSVVIADGQKKIIPVVLSGTCSEKKLALEVSNSYETKKVILPVKLSSQDVCYNVNILTSEVVVGDNHFIEIRNDGTQNVTLDISLASSLADIKSKRLVIASGEIGKTNLAINTGAFSGIEEAVITADLKDKASFQKTIYFFNGFNLVDYAKYYWYYTILVVLFLMYLVVKMFKLYRKFKRRHITEFRWETLDGNVEVSISNSIIKNLNLKTKFLLTDVGIDIIPSTNSFTIVPINSEISDFEKIEAVLNVDDKNIADNFVKAIYVESNGARVNVVKSKGLYKFVISSFGKFILNYEIDEDKKKLSDEKIRVAQEKTRLSLEKELLKKQNVASSIDLNAQSSVSSDSVVEVSTKSQSANRSTIIKDAATKQTTSTYIETIDNVDDMTSSFRRSFLYVSLIVVLAGLFIALSYYGLFLYVVGLFLVVLLFLFLFRKKHDVILDDTEEMLLAKSSNGVNKSEKIGFISKVIDFLTEESDDGGFDKEKKDYSSQLKEMDKEQKRLEKERLNADKEYQKKIEFEEKKLAAERAKLEKDFEQRTAQENKRLNSEKQDFEKNMLLKIKEEESKLNIEKEKMMKEYRAQLDEFETKKEMESKKLRVQSDGLHELKSKLDLKEKEISEREFNINNKLLKLDIEKKDIETRLVEISIKEKELDIQISKLKKDQEEVEAKLDSIYEKEKELDSKLYDIDLQTKTKYEELTRKEKMIKEQEKLISTSKIEAEKKVNQVLDKISKKEKEIEKLRHSGSTFKFSFKYLFYFVVIAFILFLIVYFIVSFFNRPVPVVDTGFLVSSLDNAVKNPVIEVPSDNGGILKYVLIAVVFMYIYVAVKKAKAKSRIVKPVDLDTDVNDPQDDKF